ncbi:hypothetical protein CC2G_005143 [Coprinopsis cinerea AmutBmut pab1-1]|nr:hypothetical protein CC2G_005143 [Coprinopsis cinerea AmutBmut pab1-1]
MDVMLDTTDIDHIDIDFTDREETNSAFQLEGFFELWEEWAQALRDEDNDQKEGCGNPDCGDTPPCDPLLDDMACGLCALQGPEAYDQCGFFKQYMAYHLQHDAGMPITSIPGFLEQFQTFKTTLLGDRPPSASRAGVNGDMWILDIPQPVIENLSLRTSIALSSILSVCDSDRPLELDSRTRTSIQNSRTPKLQNDYDDLRTPSTPPYGCYNQPHAFYSDKKFDVHLNPVGKWIHCTRQPCPHRLSKQPEEFPSWGVPCDTVEQTEFDPDLVEESLQKALESRTERRNKQKEERRLQKKHQKATKSPRSRGPTEIERTLSDQLKNLNIDQPIPSKNQEDPETDSDTDMAGNNNNNTTKNDSKSDNGKVIPKRFNGNRYHYQAFRDAVDLFFITDDKHDTDQKKIAFVLALLDEGEARIWRTNYLRQCRKNGKLDLGNFDELLKKLDDTFKQPEEEDEALFALNNMKQRPNERAEQTITRFREQASLAGLDLTKNDRIAIDYLKDVLDPGLVDKVSLDVREPDTFEEWVKLAIKYDRVYRRNKLLKSLGKRGNTPNFRKTLSAFARSTRNNSERDPDAMDIDAISTDERTRMMKTGSCFYCREQDPREAAKYIRRLLAQYSPEEEAEILEAAGDALDEDEDDDQEDF